jgi:hypothetical protein
MRQITISLLLAILLSCSKESKISNDSMPKEIPPSKVKLVQKEILSLPLDNESSYIAYPFRIGYSRSMELLHLWNDFNQSLYFFDLNEKKQVAKIPIQLREDLGINEVSLVYVHSMDSIFILDQASTKAPKLHIFNANTRGVVSFPMLANEDQQYVDSFRPMFYVDLPSGNVFLRLAISRNGAIKESPKSILRYNFKTQKEDLLIDFPDDYRDDDDKAGPGISFDFDKKGNLLFALPFGNEFLVVDSSTSRIKKQIPRSSPVMPPYTPIGDNLSPIEHRFRKQELSRWTQLTYDPYRDLIFHVGIVGQEMPNPLPDHIMTSVPKRKTVNGDSVYFYMMVYDEEYNFLGEMDAKAIANPIITPQGILELKYFRSPEESEDELMFYVYEIERVEEQL